MAPKKKKTEPVQEQEELVKPVQEQQVEQVTEQKPIQKPKHSIGSIVYICKNADADLNGFKLFPQYKKYTYTVEAYDEKSDVYTLRRLNLSLRLKGELILAPEERAHDSVNRRQF